MNTTTFDLLSVAVELAREQKVSNVDGLRALMHQQFPQQLTQFDEALSLLVVVRKALSPGGWHG